MWTTGELHRKVTLRLLPHDHPSRVFLEAQLRVRNKLVDATVPAARTRGRSLPSVEASAIAFASVGATVVSLLSQT